MIINFGPWLPDQPRFGNTCITAENVYPSANGYRPFKGSSAITAALPSLCIGNISFKRVSGGLETFAGTSTGLYRLNGTSWDDVAPSAYSPSAFWRFAVYGDILVATNGVDNPQKFDLSSDTQFSDLTNAPKHKFPIVVRDTLVALDLTDGSGFQVKWSAVNDATDWTAASGGGAQVLPDGGPVVGGTGGEYGVILQEQGLTRMDFVGGDLRFTFDKIEGAVGCIAKNSIVQYKGRTFFLSDEGFQVFDGAETTNISNEICTRTFFSELAAAEPLTTDTGEDIVTDLGEIISVGALQAVDGALDPRNSCVVWKYPTSTTTKLIIYNYSLNRWSYSNAVIDQLLTLQQVGGPVLAGMDSSDMLASFSGSDLTAVVSTGDLQLIKGRGTSVNCIRGLVDAAHDITVGKKYDLADTETTVSGSSNSNGKVSLRARSRYHRIQVSPTAAFTELTGVDVEVAPAGGRA